MSSEPRIDDLQAAIDAMLQPPPKPEGITMEPRKPVAAVDVKKTVEPTTDNQQPTTQKKIQTYTVPVQTSRSADAKSPHQLDLRALVEAKQEKNNRRSLVLRQLEAAMNSSSRKTVAVPRSYEQKKAPARIDEPESSLAPEEIAEQFNEPRFSLPLHWYRPALAFAAICLVIILPVKGFHMVRAVMDSRDNVVASSEQGVQALKDAGSSLATDPVTAAAQFAAAHTNFSEAADSVAELEKSIGALAAIIPSGGKQLDAAKRLTAAGERVAELGQRLTDITKRLYAANDQSVTEKINTMADECISVKPLIDSLVDVLAPIDASTLPEAQQATFIAGREKLATLQSNFGDLVTLLDTFASILGDNQARRYLVIFQNPHEIRPTGGFMGSIALVDMHHGEITSITIPGGGSYDFRGSQKRLSRAPQPLQLINARWELQDTNWFFDFPTSAKQIEAYLQSAGGPSVDGVIAINATLIADILPATAPLTLPNSTTTLTRDNFIAEVQKAIDSTEKNKTNKPKQVLADLAPTLIAQLFDTKKTDWKPMISTLASGLARREVQMYMFDPQIQATVAAQGWSGAVKQETKDYLAVVHANIGGGKTDGVMTTDIAHDVAIQDDGSIIATITMTRTHGGSPTDRYTGVSNIDYVQFVVPAGSQLLNATGFTAPDAKLYHVMPDHLTPDALIATQEKETTIHTPSGTAIYPQSGKTVFGNWVITAPGDTQVVSMQYALPFSVQQPHASWLSSVVNGKPASLFYSVLYQKQSGAAKTHLTSTISAPGSWQLGQFYPTTATKQGNRVSQSIELQQDTMTGVMIEPR